MYDETIYEKKFSNFKASIANIVKLMNLKPVY